MGKWSVSGHDVKGFLAALLFLYSLLLLLLKKKVCNRVDCQRSKKKKRAKHTRDLKDAFLIGRNGTKRANSRGSPLFQATYNRKAEKQTINLTYLVSVSFIV